jgi:hypothetical protein
MGRWCKWLTCQSPKLKTKGSIPLRPAKKIFFGTCCFFKFLDVATTFVAIRCYGVVVEANPVVRWTIFYLGLPWAIIVNFVSSIILFYFLYKLSKNLLPLIILSVMILSVVLNNIYVLNILRGMFP